MNARSRWIIALGCLAFPFAANATFSVVACAPDGTCGAAVATNNLAVGASVIHAKAGVGALATQYETNPTYGPRGLERLAAGSAPADVMSDLLANDGNFDGTTTAARQVGIVSAAGESATYTGEEAAASAWAGARHGKGYAVQGNGLASARVLAAMETAFLSCRATLANCLMSALEAGEQAGGQTTGRLSAALLVRTPGGGWEDIDLRVDASASPVPDLRRLLDRYYAHQAMIKAERLAGRGKIAEAKLALAEALHLSWHWDRIWRRAARLSMRLGALDDALAQLGVFASENPVWARIELQDPIYRPLRDNALFKAWAGEPGADAGAKPK
ncbi:DUF1028 domain-containing protein [Xanthomonas sp. NCPPB 2654]|uniref:DUF1028 domain-containing protein n=1 Tax=unclassified Xanthomonas TaxID=2643310 RepID=UPI0021E0E929|nr:MULTISPECIES: DUF1028 domain-containing protein [unclassified Xanthomonas]MDL5366107.1 DUF1028 domain-containing protein [Xanthomonas sp. NCPPB 2654]UYC20804.1 DUF1028 domain-containing protein [Xanthomonas sp. CFBP 8443]